MDKSIVYFSKTVSPENAARMFLMLATELKGNIAVKIHSGEEGNQNYLKPEFMKPCIDIVGGTVVECNTAYEGSRNHTPEHIELLKKHGWLEAFKKVEIMDSEGPDLILPVENGKVLTKNYVGKHIKNYDSMLVLSHFKGHPMGGFGGALKQLSIGCASTAGKVNIHSGGVTLDQNEFWQKVAEQDTFCEAMADAAKSVVDMFGGNMAFVNVVANLSVDCDCCAVAEDPCMKDIGILSSLDPVALDKACVDLIYASDDPGKDHLIERIEEKHGIHTVDAAAEIGIGTKEYELIDVG